MLNQRTNRSLRARQRMGGMAILAAVLMVPLVGMLAFAVDYGYLLQQRASLQRAADAAALAAVRDLVPDSDGDQDFDAVRATVRTYAADNITDIDDFSVLDADIEMGRYDPDTIYSSVNLMDDGTYDTVRVTLRRDSQANAPVALFFAHIFGIGQSDVRATATAVLQKARFLEPGAGVLPFTIPQAEWEATSPGDVWTVYGDGKLTDDDGDDIPGNWGTCNIGSSNNSTSDMRDQIRNGLRQKDLDALYSDGRISSSAHIDSQQSFYANGDPGLSSGMKHAVEAVHGQTKLIPIYDSVSGSGNNTEFHIVGWAVCEVVDSKFKGSNDTYVKIKKSHAFDAMLKPNNDLSATSGVIEGAFTSPGLVE